MHALPMSPRADTLQHGFPKNEKLVSISQAFEFLVRPTGIEPVAYSLGGCRSIQLSYERSGITLCFVISKVKHHDQKIFAAQRKPAPTTPTSM